ncbi:MAG: hypothetical protein JNN11_05285 [Candidatus Doudnabacteria bacterium]|nr:hypothetical protein [Candidatus Doudnabacteria bacterium]
MSKSTKIIGVLATAAVVLLVVLNSQDRLNPYGVSAVEKKNKEARNLPDGFPKDFPVDYTAQSLEKPQTGGERQTIIRFSTNLSASQTFVLYTEYFEKQGWEILGKLDEKVVTSLTAKNSKGDILGLTFSPLTAQKTNVNAVLTKAE